MVIPVTSRSRDFYWYVPLDQGESGLEKNSYAICDQVRNVSLVRFTPKCLGFVSDYVLEQIEERLKVLFYLIAK